MDQATAWALHAVHTALADVQAALAGLAAVLPDTTARPRALTGLARQLQLAAADLTAWQAFLTDRTRPPPRAKEPPDA